MRQPDEDVSRHTPAVTPLTALSPGNWQRIGIVFAVALLMACWLPYHFAVGGLPDNVSLAVAAGFDQHTAVLGIAGALGLASLWAAMRPAPTVALPMVTSGSRFDLNASFTATVAALLVITVLLYLNGDDRYNEIFYFTDRKNLMALGRIPYRDFLFNYGPVLIWAPYLAYLAMPGDWLLAYVLVDLAFLLLSLVLIRQLVRDLPIPDLTRGIVFLTLALFWLPLTYASGLHYCGIRFVLPVVLAFRMRRLRGAGMLRLCLQPLAAILLAGAISFEIGIVVAVFCVGVLLFFALAERRAQPALALMVLFATVAVLVMALPAWFTAPLTANFSGREFPLVPNTFLLFVLLSLCVATLTGLPPLLRAAAAGRLVMGSADLGVCFVAMIALLLIPGAFGRADFVHMFAFGFGAIVVALCWAANAPRRLRLLIYCGVAIEVVVMNHAMFVYPNLINLRYGQWARWVERGLGPGSAGAKPAPVRNDIETSRKLAARYPGIYDAFFVAEPVAGINSGFFTGSNDVAGPASRARKRAELRDSRYYLIETAMQAPKPAVPGTQLDYDEVMFPYFVNWPFAIPFTKPKSASDLTNFFDAAVRNCVPVERIGAITVCRNREHP